MLTDSGRFSSQSLKAGERVMVVLRTRTTGPWAAARSSSTISRGSHHRSVHDDGSKGAAFTGGLGGAALIELREQEALAAASVLGIDECVFLRNPDAALQCSPRAVEQLGRLLDSLRPDVLYAPSPFDTHRDHRQACAIAARALAGCSWPVQVYLCETWAPVPANCAVVIDLERKIQALRIYRSQMDGRELYVTGATALARYRGLTCLPGRDVAVECFLRVDRGAFVELARSAA